MHATIWQIFNTKRIRYETEIMWIYLQHAWKNSWNWFKWIYFWRFLAIWNHCAWARAQVIDFWQLFFASSQKSQLIGAIHFRMAAIGGGSRLRLSAMKSYAHQSEILAKRPTMNFHVLLPLCWWARQAGPLWAVHEHHNRRYCTMLDFDYFSVRSKITS